MDWPSETVMHQFHALSQAVGLTTEDGPLEAIIPDRRAPGGERYAVIDGETVDELVSRGWVQLIGEDEIEATDQGIYWLKKWCSTKEREAKHARMAR